MLRSRNPSLFAVFCGAIRQTTVEKSKNLLTRICRLFASTFLKNILKSNFVINYQFLLSFMIHDFHVGFISIVLISSFCKNFPLKIFFTTLFEGGRWRAGNFAENKESQICRYFLIIRYNFIYENLIWRPSLTVPAICWCQTEV